MVGQQADVFHSQFNLFSWKGEPGIPSTIQTMAQTPDGYVWIGCDYGIIRFDGYSAHLFDRHSAGMLTEDDCLSLIVAHDSSLYCGLYNGLFLRYMNGDFSQLADPELFKRRSITGLCEDTTGTIWLATDGAGVFSYTRDGTFTNYARKEGLPTDGIQAICNGGRDGIWVGTEHGLSRILNGVVSSFTKENGLPFLDISTLNTDASGILWIGGYEGGLATYCQGVFAPVTDPVFPVASAITSIYREANGWCWIGTANDGIIVVDPLSLATARITAQNGLSSNLIKVVLPDREGDLLVGTEEGSLVRIRKNIITTYSRSNGLPEDYVMSVLADPEGKIWMGFIDGSIVNYDGKTFTNLSDRFGISGMPVFSMTSSRDKTLWAGTFGELIGVNADKKQVFPSRSILPNTLFHAVYTSRNGAIWAGTDAGVIVFDKERTTTLVSADGLTDEKIFCFLEDKKGNMWIGTQEGGIVVAGANGIRTITRTDGLSDNLILCFYEDAEGSMWVGTGHDGLNYIEQGTGKILQANAILGYPRSVTYITEDQSGRLWIGTTNGIISASRNELVDYMQGNGVFPVIQYYTQSEGMPWNSCTAGVFPGGCIGPDGRIWFSTPKGVAIVDPQHTGPAIYAPRLFIEEFSVNGTSQRLTPETILAPGVIHLEIRYSAPSFVSPQQLRFKYKLDGYDKEWVDAGSRRTAFYTKVPAGSYTFRVQVCNHHGQWCENETVIAFQINPHFYETSWFFFLCILFAGFIIYAVVRYRIRQIREKELEVLVAKRTEQLSELNRELDLRVLDRTAELAAANQELEAFSYSVSHDLRAPVRRIEGLVDVLQEEYSSRMDSTGQDLLQKITDSSMEMGQLIEEFLKLARIARQETDKTSIDLSSMATEILHDLKRHDPGRSVEFNVTPGITVNADLLLMRIALQNLLNNAWKYTSKEATAEIVFGEEKQGNQTIFFIRDNGVGFDMAHYEKLFTPFLRLHSDDQFTGTGIGLATVKRIIMKHGGRIWAESKPRTGSTFYFTL